ncbi:MAG: hypothetical protein DRQ03_02420 [Candidatus Hydrothermota bacterium]|nr:MAG: hypothetical protein DRQ03_02420 [Candidatus Hydrothermae bacterium]
MEVRILASESLGVRSYATFIDTGELKIIIDPSMALGPRRYGLPPHKEEIETMFNRWQLLNQYLKISNIVIVTHYHYDHHTYRNAYYISSKIILLKHPYEFNTRKHRMRAELFMQTIRCYNAKANIQYVDGEKIKIKNTLIEFSPPLVHGKNRFQGYVLSVYITTEKKSILFSSDVLGILTDPQKKFFMERNMDIFLLDGFPTYLLGQHYNREILEKSIDNVLEVLWKTKPEIVVLDHHCTRELNWRKSYERLFKESPNSVRILTAAEFMKQPERLLEAKRQKLFKLFPSSEKI